MLTQGYMFTPSIFQGKEKRHSCYPTETPFHVHEDLNLHTISILQSSAFPLSLMDLKFIGSKAASSFPPIVSET